MSNNLEEVATVDLSVETPSVPETGFGNVGCLSGTTSATWTTPEKTRSYSTEAALLVDFPAPTPEAKAGARYFGQSRTPGPFVALKMSAPAAMMADVAAVTPLTQVVTTFIFSIIGCTHTGVLIPETDISFTSDASPSAAEVATGLAAAVTTAALTDITASNVGSACRVVGAAGAWFAIRLKSIAGVSYGPDEDGLNLLSLAMVGAEPGTAIATQLNACVAQNPNWFGLINPYQSKAIEAACAAWVPGVRRMLIQSVCDTAPGTAVLSGATDEPALALGQAYKGVDFIYNERADDFADAAWYGEWLTIDPGQDDSANKTLEGVTPSRLTDTQKTNLKARRMSYYITIGLLGRTREGMTTSGSYLELERGEYFLAARLQEHVVSEVLDALKLGLDAFGIARIDDQVHQTLDPMLVDPRRGSGILRSYTTTPPSIDDVSDSDLSTGTLDHFGISGILQVATKHIKFHVGLSLS